MNPDATKQIKALMRMLSVRPRVDIVRILADGSTTADQIAKRLNSDVVRLVRHLKKLHKNNIVELHGGRYSLSGQTELISTAACHRIRFTTPAGGILELGLRSDDAATDQ